MPIQQNDARDILYQVASNYALRLTDPNDPDAAGRPPLTAEMVAVGRGKVRLAELVHQGLRRELMSLNHLVLVTQQALAQVRQEAGQDSDEYKGALFALTSILGFAKGGWNALTDPSLAAYLKPASKRR